MKEPDEACHGLFVAHQEFPEALEPGVGHLHDPAPRPMLRIIQDDRAFFFRQGHMRNEVAVAHDFMGWRTLVAFVDTEVNFDGRAEFRDDQSIKQGFKLGHIMPVCAAHDEG